MMIKSRSGYIFLFSLFIIIYLSSCRTTDYISQNQKRTADLYNPSRSSLRPEFVVNHINDSITVTYLRLLPAQLLFTQTNESGESTAVFSVAYEFYRYENEFKKEQ